MYFFFQAEDGIRYLTVTGVQTCASSLLLSQAWLSAGPARRPVPPGSRRAADSADALGFAAVSRGSRVQIWARSSGKLTAQAATRRAARRRPGWGPALPAGSKPPWLSTYEARRRSSVSSSAAVGS